MVRDPINREITIYHFQLVKKIEYINPFVVLYCFILILFIIILSFVMGPLGIASAILGYLVLQVIHTFIIAFVQKVRSGSFFKHWSIQMRFLWIGFLPKSYISLKFMRLLHHHLLWIGFAFIGCFIPWLSPSFLITLIFMHIWMLAPRLIILYSFNAKNDGIIKIKVRDTSHYLQ